jgi:hypothetical protein
MSFLELYHKSLVADATEAGLPDTSQTRVLMVWIIWLLTSRGEAHVLPHGPQDSNPDCVHQTGSKRKTRISWKSSCSSFDHTCLPLDRCIHVYTLWKT